ncbi:hypothetical protein RF11_10415 [Thelohanellus kitauei]|uniref:Tc1-like transposase DDE domain-containing protein n=1 Tax=Thelohanellus kitauei TaxID=669202 RepID=A0A0C2NM98_THEKT|nr:hypothetical protein RF11_10415 [Thelohanellus kitauei]
MTKDNTCTFKKVQIKDMTQPFEDNLSISTIVTGSVSDLGDADHLAFSKAQDHPFNEDNFCGCIMKAFEQFLSSGIHKCIFIMDNLRFHKTNRVQAMLKENGHMIIYLPPYSPFLNKTENLLPKWKNIVKTASRDQ